MVAYRCGDAIMRTDTVLFGSDFPLRVNNYTLMGPGRNFCGGGRSGIRLSTTMNSRKPGDVPIYDDYVEPKAYGHSVVYLIKFQDLGCKESERKVSLGQKVFAIVGNKRGSVGYSLGNVSSFVHAE